MTKNTKKKNGGAIPKKKPKIQVPKARFDRGMEAYRALLEDPCAAPMVHAPFAGMGSSYLVRTVNALQPSITSIAASGTMDLFLEFTPWNLPAMACFGSAYPGGTMTATNGSLSNFVTSALVKSYRPVAACLKWVPSGNIAGRSGIIGLSYSPEKTTTPGVANYGISMISSTMHQAPNGSESHEVRWLPSFEDARFGSSAETNVVGAGSCMLVALNVDYTGNGSAGICNGFIEMTVVWEWEPAIGTANVPNGVVPSLSTPAKFTLNDVLGSIGDVGNFVVHTARRAAVAYDWATGGVRRGASLLTG